MLSQGHPESESLISAKEAAEVEALYRRLTTPLRCRLRWHKWTDWGVACSLQAQSIAKSTNRCTHAFIVDLETRSCHRCGFMTFRVKTRLAMPGEDLAGDE